MGTVRMRLLKNKDPHECLGDRPTENPMCSDAHPALPPRIYLSNLLSPECVCHHGQATAFLLCLDVCVRLTTAPGPVQRLSPAPGHLPCLRRLDISHAYSAWTQQFARYFLIPEIPPEGVNGKLDLCHGPG